MAAGEAVRGQHTLGWKWGEIPREDTGQGGILHLWVPGVQGEESGVRGGHGPGCGTLCPGGH